MKYCIIALFLLTSCLSPKELFINKLKNSYQITTEEKPKIYYIDSDTNKKIKVASVDEIIYGKFGGKILLTYKVTVDNTLYTNTTEIVAWIFVTHKEVEQVEIRY